MNERKGSTETRYNVSAILARIKEVVKEASNNKFDVTLGREWHSDGTALRTCTVTYNSQVVWESPLVVSTDGEKTFDLSWIAGENQVPTENLRELIKSHYEEYRKKEVSS